MQNHEEKKNIYVNYIEKCEYLVQQRPKTKSFIINERSRIIDYDHFLKHQENEFSMSYNGSFSNHLFSFLKVI